jgi:23S rRNA (cytosine1962-C5)-methyltransferase
MSAPRLQAPTIAAEPLALTASTWPDYALVDSGGGRKLERFGAHLLVRPEGQCLWSPTDPVLWDSADAVFEASDDEEAGRWRTVRPLPATWPLAWNDIRFAARLTAFRHLGVFPEQAANWDWLSERILGAGDQPSVLNLFGYTGLASLVAAARGAVVTHVDASKKAIGWARENAAVAGLAEAPIRWICEDARAWVRREQRRGASYRGIILDPPKYGRGPAGEVWRLYEDLPGLIAGCNAILAADADFLLINAYSERVSGLALASLLAEALAGRGGIIDWGELTLRQTGGLRAMGMSFFARWLPP